MKDSRFFVKVGITAAVVVVALALWDNLLADMLLPATTTDTTGQ